MKRIALVALLTGCGALTGVDWDRAHGSADAGSDPDASTSRGSPTAPGTTTDPTTMPQGSCATGQVECVTGCCARNDDVGQPISIAARGSTTCVTTTTGLVRCWGDGATGELGRDDTSTTKTNRPLTVSKIAGGTKAVAVGMNHACALVGDVLACWGQNAQGQFGNGNQDASRTPIKIARGAVPTQISAGTATMCAIAGSQVTCWGNNLAQQAGGPDATPYLLAPTPLQGVTDPDLQRTATGDSHACATGTSHVYCWGTNSTNRLGAASAPSQTATPFAVKNLDGQATALAVGVSHACAIVAGELRCWGSNFWGELGLETGSLPSDGAVTTTGASSGVTDVCTGFGHTCSVQSGVVRCSGLGNLGQIGAGANVDAQKLPATVALPRPATKLACGNYFACALLDDRSIACWGENDHGELGDGTSDRSASAPRTVIWP